MFLECNTMVEMPKNRSLNCRATANSRSTKNSKQQMSSKSANYFITNKIVHWNPISIDKYIIKVTLGKYIKLH